MTESILPGKSLTNKQCARMASTVVAEAVGFTVGGIYTPKKGPAHRVFWRQVAMALMSNVASRGQNDIAVGFSRDRATVHNALRIVEELRECHEFDDWMEKLEHRFNLALNLADYTIPRGQWNDVVSALTVAGLEAQFDGETHQRAESFALNIGVKAVPQIT